AALADRERRLGIRRGLDRQRAVGVLDQPRPARAELPGGGLAELGLEVAEAAKRLVDRGGDRAGRVAAALGRHRVPEERVIPDLRGVVEDLLLARLALRRLHDLFVRHALVLGARRELVEVVDVRLVV